MSVFVFVFVFAFAVVGGLGGIYIYVHTYTYNPTINKQTNSPTQIQQPPPSRSQPRTVGRCCTSFTRPKVPVPSVRSCLFGLNGLSFVGLCVNDAGTGGPMPSRQTAHTSFPRHTQNFDDSRC